MKLVKESLHEFVRGVGPKESLGLGRIGSIRKFFRNLDINDNEYIITEDQIIFKGYLDLCATDITELPEGLSIGGYLSLRKTPIIELPEKISVEGSLNLSGTNITKLPESLNVKLNIYIDDSQTQLKNYIESSKFANKLRIW